MFSFDYIKKIICSVVRMEDLDMIYLEPYFHVVVLCDLSLWGDTSAVNTVLKEHKTTHIFKVT